MDIPFRFRRVKWSDTIKFFPGLPNKPELQAPVREFSDCTIEPQNQTTKCTIFADGGKYEGWLKFDREDITDTQRLRCIVVGMAQMGMKRLESDMEEHYVLVVTQREGGHYERVGVGSIQRKHISFEAGVMEWIN